MVQRILIKDTKGWLVIKFKKMEGRRVETKMDLLELLKDPGHFVLL